ncbi:hypothetical protein M9H77_02478 [Catharanthus roseus]|uniref:Uncharacterized protein n=1 Tax=Catharanthus roseus TaxID=4058 RepID=A0ACC0C908_CATRO|nr:hypothetical protein M9H77_02478 [Catharanthus roseus]
MDTIHPVRVVLFWDSKHARDEYDPYFTEAAKKTWTFTRMTFSQVQHTHVSTDEDHLNIRQYVTAITEMVSDKPSMLYPDVEEDDEDDDNADEDYDVSNKSDDEHKPNDEEHDINTSVNPLSSTTMNQWQSNIGSGEQIDDVIESDTIRLLYWKDAMTDP